MECIYLEVSLTVANEIILSQVIGLLIPIQTHTSIRSID